MANDLTTNPWRIDTAGAALLATGPVFVKGFRWVAPAAGAGNTVVVQDSNNKTKWEAVAAGPNHEEADEVEDVTPWDGLKVTTLASGVLYIQYR